MAPQLTGPDATALETAVLPICRQRFSPSGVGGGGSAFAGPVIGGEGGDVIGGEGGDVVGAES